jgi:hypothetical protein
MTGHLPAADFVCVLPVMMAGKLSVGKAAVNCRKRRRDKLVDMVSSSKKFDSRQHDET